ncbi:hypothetical protein BB558_004713 [Smittium angustum]|uniref:Protein BFR2 n=1 Tax=Smittium angustum TaxID=133377 RepID=A0A2U1J2N4_SMIAN|nr:hypothetical protein BB558_004713 [Smittium angustum]
MNRSAPKKSTLIKKLLELENPAPKDYDIEKDDLQGKYSSESEDEEKTENLSSLRNHYLHVGKSKLRMETDSLQLDSKYKGVKKSRKDLDFKTLSPEISESEIHSDTENSESNTDVSSENDSEDNSNENDSEDSLNEKDSEDNSSENEGSETGYDSQESLSNTKVKQELLKLKLSEQKIISDLNETKQQDALKGKHIINQTKIWEAVLDLRIRSQKFIQKANELPSAQSLNNLDTFIPSSQINESKEISSELENVSTLVTNLLSNVIDIQNTLVHKDPKILALNNNKRNSDQIDDSNEDQCDLIWEKLEKNRKLFKPYKDQTLNKWDSRVNMLPSSLSSKTLKTFNQNIVNQIDQTMKNKEKLIKRTQQPRLGYSFLLPTSTTNEPKSTNFEEKTTFIPEIFDDTDFYQSLLHDLIESKSSNIPGATAIGNAGLQWATVQRSLKSKTRQIDTKASKGRKIRYQVHEKLENFMAPQTSRQLSTVANSSRNEKAVNIWNDEQITELFSSLLGKIVQPTQEASLDVESDTETNLENKMDGIKLFNF